MRLACIVVCALLSLAWCAIAVAEEARPTADSAQSVFTRRILPIFNADKPSSCTECHLSGIELKDFIRASQEETFSALVTGGLVDLDNPDDSKILRFIERRPDTPNLITEKVRLQELEAFREWIHAAVDDPALRASKAVAAAAPRVPVEVVRHGRVDRVLASFVENVWSERGRCNHCHSSAENQKLVAKHGEQMSWITPDDPQATMDYMVAAGIIDLDHPEESPFLTKPTLQVEHGGGPKFAIGDRTYKQFLRFAIDLAAIKQGKYASAGDLPQVDPEALVASDLWLRLVDVPAEYDGLIMQVDLYRRTGAGWSAKRVATGDRPVMGPRKAWQQPMRLVAARGSQQAEQFAASTLQPGRYLAKVYLDRHGRMSKDPLAEFAPDDLVGQFEFESEWKPGAANMTIASYAEHFPSDSIAAGE